jgi:two-component system response regulator RegA
MKKKGFNVEIFGDIKQTKKRIKEKLFDYAIVDMRLENGSGLELIKLIKKINPKTRALLLTGYGNIATAVAAIKSGAIDYLTKPAAIDQIYESLLFSKDTLPSPPLYPMTANRARWEHIQRVFIQCKRNVSETARRLRMHRRTLQRILNKHAPKE